MLESSAVNPGAYRSLGLVNNPFPPIQEGASNPYWMRVLTHVAADAALAGCARAARRGRPVMLVQSSDLPENYPRAALAEFLHTSTLDPELAMLPMSTALGVMKLGTIRGPLAEVAERVTAMNLPLTVGLYFADVLRDSDLSIPEGSALVDGQLQEAAAAFSEAPDSAMLRYLGRKSSAHVPSRDEEYDAMHMTYVRGAHLEKATDADADAALESDETDDAATFAADATGGILVADEAPTEMVDPDMAVREHLLELVRADLSPVVARSLSRYADFGENMVAQELRVTKAPRKTLEALLRLMSHRWKSVIFIFDGLEFWPQLDQDAKLDVMSALNELRWIFGKTGAMGLNLVKGSAPELEEVFAAAEQVDLSFSGFNAVYGRDSAEWDAPLVQSWIDAASAELPSSVQVEDELMAPVVEAAEGDVLRFALIAEVAFRNAAERNIEALDAEAIAAAVASVRVEEGA